MADFVHRTTKQHIVSRDQTELPDQPWENFYIINPDLSAVAGVPNRYWKITGDSITEMSQAEKDAVDNAALQASRDALANQIDQVEDVLRASLLSILDEFNAHADKINAILDSADAATSLADFKTRMAAVTDYPQRTIAQLKTTIRNKLGS
jgi:hypothetical protein